jgi:hypothetical protein
VTVIFDARLDPNLAQTHALIVGVGAYPHLPGGEKENVDPAVRDFGLGQITSTVVSASRMADWLLTRHRNPNSPLGSVTLLLSPAVYEPSDAAATRLGEPASAKVAVNLATSDLIREAFGGWYLRLNRRLGNIGLFFFAGHGLEASDRYLVPADFGANPLDPYDRLLNFTVTHSRMDRCQAQTQLYFLDACRERPKELREAAAEGPIGIHLIGPQGGSPVERDAPIFHAAVKGQQAAGEPGEVSYFTQALIDCLNGMGARDASGHDCPINHASLATAVKESVTRVADEKELPLACSVLTVADLDVAVDFHLAQAPIPVMTLVECLPAAAHLAASRLWLEDSTSKTHDAPNPRRARWRHKVPAGSCVVQANYAEGDAWEEFALQGIAVPPLFKPTIRVKPRGA